MARRRLRLSYNVINLKEKHSTRKRGMFKTLDELTVLCGVDAAIIMYNSFELGPVVWPSVEEAQQRIARFMNSPDVQQTRRVMSQESFVLGRIQKLSIKLLKVKKNNREREMNALMHRIFTGE
ncbi:PREDICTED: agamous-like MADS-box protein AGL80 [Ipomoea nil]|uniref:agamous-like MADS-box protein AGL80 n=1 Tax=Ipomoea nil TaxID=35883 RepID=UPI000901ACD0|nr:PREDICTED: agamous-like MADS-box protein AGL80 [Ipomoea nil]